MRWLATLTALLALAAAVAVAATMTSPSGTPSAGPAKLRIVGPAPAGERMRFALLLRLRHDARLRRSIARLEDPGSSSFRHFIDPESFGARFGISDARLAALERTLRAQGLRIGASYPQRTELQVSGTVSVVERLLGVRIATFADGAGRRFHAPLGTGARIPPALASTVDGVTGLDTRPRWQAHDVPLGGITPTIAAQAYDIAALHNAGILGQGQSIAVVSFAAFDPGDPRAFASQYGITGPEPKVISVDGGTTDLSGADEANLDIDVIRAIAPQAQILFYEVPQSSSSYTDVINRIVADHQTDIISSSWGQCELELDPGQRTGDARALTAAVAGGVTMFVATGDSGAYDCQASNLSDHRLTVDWPASSADAVAAGGTRLYLGPGDSYQSEAGWEDQLSAGGGGGGITTGDARPSWQTGPGVLSRLSNGRRQLPDVAGDADPGTPWSLYWGGHLGYAGGTSAAAPFWAASMLLIHQYAASRGVGRLGFVDPILYAVAASKQPFPPFHDITRGGNRFYQATRGWDFVTGLGSPDVYDLARDVVAYLRTHGR